MSAEKSTIPVRVTDQSLSTIVRALSDRRWKLFEQYALLAKNGPLGMNEADWHIWLASLAEDIRDTVDASLEVR